MNASKRYSSRYVALFGLITAILLAFGFASAVSAAYADELAAAQPADQADAQLADSVGAQPADSSAKAWDLPKDSGSAKKGANRAALSTQATQEDDGVVELAGSKLSVQSSDDSYQFVLSWGETPYDLDSHMEGYTPNGEAIHVYYSNSSESYSGDVYCTLDHDDTNSYGPETVDLKSSSRYPCYYYIHNYSGSPSMCVSHAEVKVYKGGEFVGSRKIPTKGTGRYWNICAVQNGNIVWYDQVVKKSSITESPNLSYLSFAQWSTTSYGKRVYPNYGRTHGNLDHYMTSVSGIKSYYPNFAITTSETYPVPGLEYSSANGGCDAAVPQGVCVTPNYIVVSAYCAGDLLYKMSEKASKRSGDKQFVDKELQVHNKNNTNHHPALYVIDRSSGNYIATVEIKGIGDNHVGGIAFDGSRFWIATSGKKDSSGDCQELMITLDRFEASLGGHDNASVSTSDEGVQLVSLVGSSKYFDSASYNAYDQEEGTLWVGNYKKESSTYVAGFKYENGKFKLVEHFKIPAGANGVSIVHSNGHKYLLLGTSLGRSKSSTLYRWDITGRSASYILTEGNAKSALLLPPMLEEICVYGGNLYSVYESGATVYGCFDGPTVSRKEVNGVVTYPSRKEGRADVSVDVICEAPISNVLNAQSSPKEGKADKTRISVACPVAVELLDADGDIVGKICDGWVDEDYLGEGIVAWIDGDVKSFLVPSDQQYSIRIEATDDGEMDVTAVQYNDEGVADSMAIYKNVALTEDSSYSASLATLVGDEAVSARFALADPDGEAVEPSEVVDEGVTLCQVTTVAEGDGFVSESAQVAQGDYYSVTATPEEGEVFDGWYLDGEMVTSEYTYDFWVSGDIELVARFSTPDYALDHVSVEGNGSIDADEPGATVDEEIQLQAVPDDDGWFDGWYLDGECVSTNTYYWFEADEDDGLVAKFSPAIIANVDVAAGGNENGEVQLLDSDGKVGGSATVSAYAHNCAEFEGWHIGSIDGQLVSTDAEYTFTIEGDVQLVANFVDAPERFATVTVKAVGSGVVKAGSDDEAQVVTQLSVSEESELTLTAVPGNEDVSLSVWMINGERVGSAEQKTFTIMEDTEISAWFSDATIQVNAVIVGDYEPGDIEIWPTSEELTNPESVEFSIDYDSDEYDFLGWYLDGRLISERSWVAITPAEDTTLEAHVQRLELANVYVDYNRYLGRVYYDFDNPVRVGTEVYLEADPYYSGGFEGWFIDGKRVSANEVYEFVVTDDVRIEARFAEPKVDLSHAVVSGVSACTYDGKEKKPAPTVTLEGSKLDAGVDYTVSYKNNVNAGTATMTIAGAGDFTGSITANFTINKAKQPMTASAAKKAFKVSKAKAKKKAVALKKTVAVKGNVGPVSYANASKKPALKKFKVNAKNGTITVPKGTKKGTYKLQVKVTAAGDANHASGSKTVTVKVVVK